MRRQRAILWSVDNRSPHSKTMHARNTSSWHIINRATLRDGIKTKFKGRYNECVRRMYITFALLREMIFIAPSSSRSGTFQGYRLQRTPGTPLQTDEILSRGIIFCFLLERPHQSSTSKSPSTLLRLFHRLSTSRFPSASSSTEQFGSKAANTSANGIGNTPTSHWTYSLGLPGSRPPRHPPFRSTVHALLEHIHIYRTTTSTIRWATLTGTESTATFL